MRAAALLSLFVVAPLAVAPGEAHAEVHSRVFINGRATTVYFNDGDSFRQLDGPWSGRGSRLAGFNTLESYGPTHVWGSWHPFELYINAKEATLNGRRGIWHCFTEGETDTYGRVLLDCPDLAVDQIRKGLAHAMQIDDTPARPEYLRAQHEAMRARRGMWAHGIPAFILTSLHSRAEDPTRDRQYNRLVSTRDGHSERWEHTDPYPECSTQCSTIIEADAERVRAYARELRADPNLAEVLASVPNVLLIEAVDRYARLGEIPAYFSPPDLEDEYYDPEDDDVPPAYRQVAAALEPRLQAARASGALGSTQEVRGSCMIYADFRRRYGRERAACFRRRGNWPPPGWNP